jgi:hypothetical protein
MAEPLSAFDKARTRWGWGTSSDPAERQRFAEAGLSPLTSEERMRMERGWGASPLASKESREAMVAEEVRRGDRPEWQLPETYGGRPTGTTRRAIRQQLAWDAQQAAILAQQEERRQAEMEQRRFGLQVMGEQRLQREQDLRLKEFEMSENRNNRIQSEASAIVDGIRGARLPDGSVINPIRPEDDNALERLENLARLNFGMKDETAQKMWNTLYNDALEYRQNASAAQQRQSAQEAEAKVGLVKELAVVGKSIADFTKEDGRIDFEKANAALGEAIRSGEEQKIIRGEEREEKRNINSQVSKLETDLTKIRGEVGRYQKLLEARKDSTTQRALDGALVEQGILEDEINRLNRLKGGGEAAPQSQQGTTGQRPPLSDIFGGSR